MLRSRYGACSIVVSGASGYGVAWMTHRTGIRVEGRWWRDHTVVQGHIGVFDEESEARGEFGGEKAKERGQLIVIQQPTCNMIVVEKAMVVLTANKSANVLDGGERMLDKRSEVNEVAPFGADELEVATREGSEEIRENVVLGRAPAERGLPS